MKLSPALRSLVPAVLLASFLTAAPGTASAQTGTIKGKLVWGGGAIPEPKVDVTKGDPKVKDAVCKAQTILSKDLVIDPKTLGVANGIAYLVKPAGDYKAAESALLEKTPEVLIDQVNCEFVPYVAVVHKDQKLIFKSSDPVGHNVHFTPFARENTAINTMLPPNGKLAYTVKKEERRPTKLVCDIHPWMKGYFFIVDHPFAVVTQADGSFEITGVPAGPQKLVVWQETKGYVNEGKAQGMSVTVPAGGVVDVGAIKLPK
jgi:hypothetical protein